MLKILYSFYALAARFVVCNLSICVCFFMIELHRRSHESLIISVFCKPRPFVQRTAQRMVVFNEIHQYRNYQNIKLIDCIYPTRAKPSTRAGYTRPQTAMWTKANPAMPYLPSLMTTIEKEFEEWKNNPFSNADFMRKRSRI